MTPHPLRTCEILTSIAHLSELGREFKFYKKIGSTKPSTRNKENKICFYQNAEPVYFVASSHFFKICIIYRVVNFKVASLLHFLCGSFLDAVLCHQYKDSAGKMSHIAYLNMLKRGFEIEIIKVVTQRGTWTV